MILYRADKLLQSNLSTVVTLGTEESGRCRESWPLWGGTGVICHVLK